MTKPIINLICQSYKTFQMQAKTDFRKEHTRYQSYFVRSLVAAALLLGIFLCLIAKHDFKNDPPIKGSDIIAFFLLFTVIISLLLYSLRMEKKMTRIQDKALKALEKEQSSDPI
jgi:predicted ATPase